MPTPVTFFKRHRRGEQIKVETSFSAPGCIYVLLGVDILSRSSATSLEVDVRKGSKIMSSLRTELQGHIYNWIPLPIDTLEGLSMTVMCNKPITCYMRPLIAVYKDGELLNPHEV